MFGHGTTYGGAVFHAYEISKGQTVHLFIEKCQQVLQRKEDDPSFNLLVQATSTPVKERPLPAPQPRFHEDWYPATELELLKGVVSSVCGKPGVLVEIGCWEGRSTAVIANACHPETLIAVDHWQGNVSESPDHLSARLIRDRDVFETFRENMRTLTRANVTLQRAEALAYLRKAEGPIKFCHLDAANDFPFLREVLVALLPKLSPEGIICGHNFEVAHAGRADLQGGIERAVRELLPGFKANGNFWSYVRRSQ